MIYEADIRGPFFNFKNPGTFLENYHIYQWQDVISNATHDEFHNNKNYAKQKQKSPSRKCGSKANISKLFK